MLEIDITVPRKSFRLHAASSLDAPLTGIFGPSGAGKSTLLSAIAGLENTARGRIALDGEVLLDTTRRVSRPTHRRHIGMVFQDSRLFPHLSVRSNLLFGRRRKAAEAPSLDDVAEVLHLEPLLERRPSQLSGGEQRRVALGRALLAGPRLLLLDEPLTGLDDTLRRQVLGYLRRIHGAFGTPMLLVSHDMESILALTDRLLVLHKGRIAAQGAYIDLVQTPGMLDLLGSRGVTNVFDLEVLDRADGLAVCRPVLAPGDTTSLAGGGRLPVLKVAASEHAVPGRRLRICLPPGDVAMSPTPVAGMSVQNQVAARMVRPLETSGARWCLLDAGPKILVSANAATPPPSGAPLWCLFKAESLRPI